MYNHLMGVSYVYHHGIQKFQKKKFLVFGQRRSFHGLSITVLEKFQKKKFFFFRYGMVILSALHTCIIMVLKNFQKNLCFFGKKWTFYRRFIRVSSWY